MMHESGKSDAAVVAMKPVNEAVQAAEEREERRTVTEGNVDQQSTVPDAEPDKRDPGAGPHTANGKGTKKRRSSPRSCTILALNCLKRNLPQAKCRSGCGWGDVARLRAKPEGQP